MKNNSNSWEIDLSAIQYQRDSPGELPNSVLGKSYLDAMMKLQEMHERCAAKFSED